MCHFHFVCYTYLYYFNILSVARIILKTFCIRKQLIEFFISLESISWWFSLSSTIHCQLIDYILITTYLCCDGELCSACWFCVCVSSHSTDNSWTTINSICWEFCYGLHCVSLRKRDNHTNQVVLIAVNKTWKGQYIYEDEVSHRSGSSVVVGAFSAIIHFSLVAI